MKRTIVTAKFDAVSLEGEQVTLKIAIGTRNPTPNPPVATIAAK